VPTSSRARSRRLVAVVGVGATLATAAATLAPSASYASSHREAPAISNDPRADNTDTYAFVSPDRPNTVTFIANWIPFEEPNGGPNFYPFAEDARYNISVDNDGDGHADVTYTWTFKDHVRHPRNHFLYNTGVVDHLDSANLNFYQTYTLSKRTPNGSTVLLKDKLVAPSDVGPASMPDYGQLRDEAIADGQLPHGGQTYAGQADDPFFLDLRVFDLLYGGDLSEAGQDTLAGYNVNTIALQVRRSAVALEHDATRNPVIGVWSTTDRRATINAAGTSGSGKWVQVSRLGAPLVNEAVVPLKYKDAFNGLRPFQDHTVTPVVNKVLDPIVPKLVEAIYGIPAPATPRLDLAEIFLTGICKACGPIDADLNSQKLNEDFVKGTFVASEELRLNMSVPPTADPERLGVLAGDFQGYPNGRRLTDDVIDISLQALEGAAQTGEIVPALAAGDAVDVNDKSFGETFPYVALPSDVAVNQTSSGLVAPVTTTGGGNDGIGGARLPIAGAAFAAAFVAAAMAMLARRRRLITA
jgi:hypothetical protein